VAIPVNTPSDHLRPTSGVGMINGRTIRCLTVVAGPTAVGKTRLLQLAATDELLRQRLRVPKAPAVTPKELLRLSSSGPIDELILHYDILKPHHKGFRSHVADPATTTLSHAETIVFLTLRTTPERLAAQLDRRIAAYERKANKRRRLQQLRGLESEYQDNGFVADWYQRWFGFVERFRSVTSASYIVDAHHDYRLTRASASGT
jgi:hypothetical protein